jgi:putative transcriptional regulator
MLMVGLGRWLLCAVVFVVSAPPPTAVRAQSATPEQGASLAGQLLIAAPEMADPRFAHAVILLVRHDASGALGIMVNRPAEQTPIADLLQAIGEADTTIQGSIQVCAGGPVEPQVGFVIHSADYRLPGSIDIDGHVAMTSDPQILRDIGHNHGPKNSFFAFGYTGWGPGQLEDEMARHVWFTTLNDPKLIFDADRESIWTTAMARRMRDL